MEKQSKSNVLICLILMLISLLCTTAITQNVINYDHRWKMFGQIEFNFVFSDSMEIENRMYHKLLSYYLNSSGDTVKLGYGGLFRELNGVVYRYSNHDGESIFYNFNLEVGDTTSNGLVFYKVLKNDSIVTCSGAKINSYLLEHLSTVLCDTSRMSELIGNMHRPWILEHYCFDEPVLYEFYINNNLEYSLFDDCIISNTNSTYEDIEMLLFPNPVIDQVCFDTKNKERFGVFVYNSSGNMVKKVELDIYENCLNLEELQSGLYVIKTIQGKLTTISKVIKN